MTILNYELIENNVCKREAELEEKINRYARVPHYVMITGERGTGKTTIARRLHEESSQAKREFVNINCASFTEGLLESELFGYERGAFTGATAPKAGLFEIAAGGTLFLDEIGEIPLNLQSKLLKAIEEKKIRRVGSNTERLVNTRIIAATSRDLKQMVRNGQFRADLYDRLNILSLETVPLRYQKEKVRELIFDRINDECSTIGRTQPLEISSQAFRLIENYEWPGNFRELLNFTAQIVVECIDENVISERVVKRVLSERTQHCVQSPVELAEKLIDMPEENLITVTFNPLTDDLDSIYLKAAGYVIKHVLSENNGNLRRAASIMGANHSTLSRIMKKFNEQCDTEIFRIPSEQSNAYAVAA